MMFILGLVAGIVAGAGVTLVILGRIFHVGV